MIVMPGSVDNPPAHLADRGGGTSTPTPTRCCYFAEMPRTGRAGLPPDDVYAGATCWGGPLSALDAGVTTPGRLVPRQEPPPDHADAAVRALAESGIRAVFAPRLAAWHPEWTRDSELGHPPDIRRLRGGGYFSSERPTSACTWPWPQVDPRWQARRMARGNLRLARELGIRTTVQRRCVCATKRALVARVSQLRDAGVLGDDITFITAATARTTEFAMMRCGGAGFRVSRRAVRAHYSAGIGDIPLDRALTAGIRPSLSGDTETKCSGDMFTQIRI